MIDSWDLNKEDKQIKFLRQAVYVSVEIVPLQYIYQKTVAKMKEFVPLK